MGDSDQGKKQARHSFEGVFSKELNLINRSRVVRRELGPCLEGHDPVTRDTCYDKTHDLGLVGLALSGGGIRSATFNLGVLQGLARFKLLSWLDYLSTVSGGGYIGAWLMAWIDRSDIFEVEEQLDPEPDAEATKNGKRDNEPEPVRRLRNWSDYLTPRRGVLSVDTWTMVSIYLRNLLLNLTILVAALVSLVTFPRGLIWLVHEVLIRNEATRIYDVAILTVLASILLAVLGVARNLRSFDLAQAQGMQVSKGSSQSEILIRIVLPIVLSASVVAFWLSQHTYVWIYKWYIWMGFGAAAYASLWALSWITHGRYKKEDAVNGLSWSHATWVALPAGAFGGLLLWSFKFLYEPGIKPGTSEIEIDAIWRLFTFAPPLLILAFGVTGVYHVGLIGRHQSSEMREWWGRLGAWIILMAVLWTVVLTLFLYGPLLLTLIRYGVGEWTGAGLFISWVVSTLAGLNAGRGESSSGRNGSARVFKLFVRATPYLFVIGLFLLVSIGVHECVPRLLSLESPIHVENIESAEIAWRLHEHTLSKSLDGKLWLVIMVSLAVALWLSARVDLNEFSMHNFYRNRLIRCYLDASLENSAGQPFTDLSMHKIPLAGLSQDRVPGPPRPQLIINAALNLTAGKQREWQQRKAVNFTFTPEFCGYDQHTGNSRISNQHEQMGFHVTNGNGDVCDEIQLGTAITISGAAASPNMGYYTSNSLAFLMTVFNVRLGYWLGNTRRDSWLRRGPHFGFGYLLLELLGKTNSNSNFVYLSDGGHFENLGLYELVKRRCRLIIVSDAGRDPNESFSDLGNAIEKIRTDFGIEIEIDLDMLRREENQRLSKWHCAVGSIHYDRVDNGAPRGCLLYLKSSLTGDEPADVARYADANPDFPHQSTADQWFDEAQFESYRALGYHVAKEVFGGAVKKRKIACAKIKDKYEQRKLDSLTTEDLITNLRRKWYPPSPHVAQSFSRHGEQLEKIFEAMRDNHLLRYFEPQIYPQWKAFMAEHQVECDSLLEGDGIIAGTRDNEDEVSWLPDSEEQRREGFYFCRQLIQIIENVYLDLELDVYHKHPDNRGWMNLFRQLAWSGIFRVTYAISAANHGARFTNFCDRELHLNIGRVCLADEVELKLESTKEEREQTAVGLGLNRTERKLVEDFVEKQGTQPKLWLCPFHLETADRRSKEDKQEFVIGFAILRAMAEMVQEVGRSLDYFRIQDHLRQMGLGRDALRLLLRHDKGITRFKTPSDLEKAEPAEQAKRAEVEEMISLLKSVWAEVRGTRFPDLDA